MNNISDIICVLVTSAVLALLLALLVVYLHSAFGLLFNGNTWVNSFKLNDEAQVIRDRELERIHAAIEREEKGLLITFLWNVTGNKDINDCALKVHEHWDWFKEERQKIQEKY